MYYPSQPVHEKNYGVVREYTTHIIIHGTGLALNATAEQELAYLGREMPASHRASYHFYIAKDGRVWSLVPPDRVAFHAGTSSWSRADAQRRNVPWPDEEGSTEYAAFNFRSIGIGLEAHNQEGEVYPDAQLDACAALCLHLMERFSIPQWRILTHAMVSAPRKTDPVAFPFAELSTRLQTLTPPKFVFNAPEPTVFKGDYGQDVLIRITGKDLRVDTRFDPANPPSRPINIAAYVPGDSYEKNRAPVSVAPQGETTVPIPDREAFMLSAKATRASDPDAKPYRISEKEAVTKYVTIIGNIVGIILSLLTVFGITTLTDLEQEQLVTAIGGAIVAIWPVVMSISAAIARSKVYSEATVDQMLADQREVIHERTR